MAIERFAAKKKIMGVFLMRTHSTLFIAAVGGILASSLACQSPAQAQGTAATSGGPAIDCKFLQKVYDDALMLSLKFRTAAGSEAAIAEVRKLYSTYESKGIEDQMATGRGPSWETIEEYEKGFAEVQRKLRDHNPELKSLWDTYQDCLSKQQAAEDMARQRVFPKRTVTSKSPETPPPPKSSEASPPKSQEDVLWEILRRVRVSPNPAEELRFTEEAAVAEIKAALQELNEERKADDAKKPRKRARTTTGASPEEATQGHSPDASAVTIMLLGTAAGIAADSLRHRGSGGGSTGGGGGGGGGGTPVKRGSGGCASGACPR